MALWRISTVEKKSCEEREIWIKENQTIVRINGFRWGSFTVETTDNCAPEGITADNPDGIDMYSYFSDNAENGAELDSMDDGWLGDWEFPNDMDEDEQQRIIDGYDENSYEFMENDGWFNDETEAWLFGPLEIVRVDQPLDDTANLKEQPLPGTAPHGPTELAPGAGILLEPLPNNKQWPFS